MKRYRTLTTCILISIFLMGILFSGCTADSIRANFSESASATRPTPSPTATVVATTFKVTSILPTRGSFSTNNTVVIKGVGFSTDATVKIGGLDCTVDSKNSGTTVITCVTSIGGSSVKGSADVVVTNSDSTTATLTGGYTYLDYPPLISSVAGAITPPTGPIAGGTTVTILGSNFVNGTSGSTVTFGLSTCTNPFYTDTTQIACTTPANAVGPITITVTNPDGQTATKTTAFTYWGDQPTISSITPPVGGSNALVTINSAASNFASGATVTIGGQSCSSVNVAGSGTYLTCYTPTLTSGAADLIVTNSDGQSSATSVGAYTYRFAAPKLSCGDNSTCGVISGAAYCWGINTDGQLGSAAGSSVSIPTAVTTLTSGVQGIAAGPSHSCGIYNGSAYCWGKGSNGRLGNGANSDSTTPVQVSGLTAAVSAVAVGGEGHSCAIVDGAAKCWGLNDKGQLGDTTTNSSNVPVSVNGLTSGVQAITAGTSHTCAIVNGAAQCWGYNSSGQLGDASTTDRLTPTAVSGLTSNVQQIGAGTSFTCALVNGAVKCWGDNTSGQLGVGTTTASTSPVTVSGLSSGVQAISVGTAHACALVYGGTIKCWGANDSNQIGVTGGAGTYKTTATAVNNISSGAIGVTAGKSHTCAILNSGFQCWGLNTSGQLGNNSTSTSSVPTSTYGADQGIHGITAGGNYTCVISNGIPKCFGRNDSGQLGNTLGTDQTSATAVSGISSGTKMIAAGNNHTCAIVNGTVMCWGDMTNGKTGQSSGSSLTQSTPAAAGNISTSGGPTAIAVGYGNSCAILNGGVQCWGDNTYGQLGNASASAYSNAAASATGLTAGITSVAVGGYHACAVINGAAKCWGKNNVSQLGDTTTTSPRTTAVQVSGLTSGVQAVATGLNHSCAIVSGGVQCWGDNTYGQLGGNSNNAYESAPIAVTGITSGATAIVAGAYHTCALVNGAVKCWGRNTYGQLGNNDTTYTDTKTPVSVSGLTAGVLEIAAGDSHTCALVGSTVKCWGLNTYTQLGVNSTTTPKSPLPVSVSGI